MLFFYRLLLAAFCISSGIPAGCQGACGWDGGTRTHYIGVKVRCVTITLHPNICRTAFNIKAGCRRPVLLSWGGIWGSNPRHPEPQSGALPTELIPPYITLARQEGFEPPTHSLEGCCSILLSYWRMSLSSWVERVMGIEPTYPAWKAGVLPLNYTRMGRSAMK